MEYDYTISPTANAEIFSAQCSKLEALGFALDDKLEDVDGSIISTYSKGKTKVDIRLDYYVDAVYMKSDSDLSESVIALDNKQGVAAA